MSGHGAPELGEVVGAAGLRVAVVAARWHETIMTALLDGANRALADCGITDATVVRVPGTFELPVAAARLARNGYDAIVTLGVVIRGETPHFDYVCQGVTAGVTQVSVSTGIPVGFGVLTVDTEQQAINRAGLPGSDEDKGYEVTVTAIQTAVTLEKL